MGQLRHIRGPFGCSPGTIYNRGCIRKTHDGEPRRSILLQFYSADQLKIYRKSYEIQSRCEIGELILEYEDVSHRKKKTSSLEILTEIGRTNIGAHKKIDQNSIEILSLVYLNAIGIQSQDNIVLSKSYWNPIETLLDFYRNSVVFLSTFYRNTVNLQSLCHQDTRK